MSTMAMQVHVDETNCGPLCQHPSCWQSNTRQAKGFPKLSASQPSLPDIELDLPTLKVCNMLDDYGNDRRDLFPSRYGGKPVHERSELYSSLEKPIRAQSIKVTRAPQTSPKSGSAAEAPMSRFKVVEVQEVFDPEDLQGTWDETFVPKSYYVWVPNKKKKRKRRTLATTMQESGLNKMKGKGSVQFKDMTEDMVPKEIEETRLTARKKRVSTRSPTIMRPYTMSPRTTRGSSSKMEFDQEGTVNTLSGQISVPIPSRLSGWRTPGQMVYLSISELLDLPRDILVQVLDNMRQSDLMSVDKIREIIRRFMPLERGNTNASLASQDLLQQKKLNLHEGNKNVRQSHLMVTKPVFHLDDDMIDDEEVDEDIQRSTSSLKDLYFSGEGNSREFSKYKKPLPSIAGGGRAVSVGDIVSSKIPSISLGLPELPSGIRQTKPFTYSKKADLDFTLGSSAGTTRTPTSTRGPVPTPPTSVRSIETAGSDHGTTILVNIPSQASARSEYGNEGAEKRLGSPARVSPNQQLYAISPSYSSRVPKAPASTPATFTQSPTKSAPLMRDLSGSALANTPQDWTPREKMDSPLQILRAPVNTPGSLVQEATGLRTIHEMGLNNDGDELIHPVSRGRSVRFEIPEVPPPPSSPQLSDDCEKEPNRNTVTINTNVPQMAPSVSSNKPMSGATIRTNATTINTTLQGENSFVRLNTAPVREISFISSPEPWPQINEADYDVAPLPSPVSTLHETPLETPQISEPLESELKSEVGAQSGNAQELVMGEEKREPSPEMEKDSEYVNKTEDQSAVVKKMMEESRKSESPAPPPPSPEAKEDSDIIINKHKSIMTPLMEEVESMKDNEVSMTVIQITPKGPPVHGRKSNQRNLDTFQNIDIPAEFDLEPGHLQLQEPSTETIIEEPEPQEVEDKTGDIAPSVQSTLANRTISEQAQSEISSSIVEPAISQASLGPILSEDSSEQREHSELFGDWTGRVVGSSESQETQAMLSTADKPEMTEDGGDHEGFKEDLREEYEKLTHEIDSTNETPETTENSKCD